jgi:hypothetical protein
MRVTGGCGVRQLAAAFSVDADSRQLAGGSASALRTVGYQAVQGRATNVGRSKLRLWRIATAQSGSKLPHSKLRL